MTAISLSVPRSTLESANDDRLSIEQIRRGLATDCIGRHMFLFDEVDSTNTKLRRLAEIGAEDGLVVLAESQMVGRGRLGKPWFSPSGVNLYISVLLRPRIRPSAVPVFAFIASLALTDAIWGEGVPAAIKWPNDVMIDDRKVAGALVSYAIVGDLVEYVILGVGVNVNVDRATLECGLGSMAAGAVSVREAAGRRIDRNAFTASFLNHLERWDDEYRAHGPDPVLAAWRERDALAGANVVVRGEGAPFRGRAIGASGEGRLIVENAYGARHYVLTGEVVVGG